jgi:hypothetical protein
MNDKLIEAEPLDEANKEKRLFAWEVIKGSNDIVINFATTMTTLSMAGVGAMLTLARLVGLDFESSIVQLTLLGAACGLFLGAAVLFAYTVRGQRMDISPDDYDDVVGQFLEVLARRRRASDIGFLLLVIATISGVLAIMSSVSS